MKNGSYLVITLISIAILDYIGSRSFEFYNSKPWFPTFYFILICFNLGIGYKYWKNTAEKWVSYIWTYIYISILSYYILFWVLYMFRLTNHNFLFKTYVHIGLSPLTFGFVYLINFLSKVRNDIEG